MSRGTYSRLRAFMQSMSPIDPGRPLRRIGGEGDGGYLVPDDIDGIAAVFSPGVSTVADFELEFAERGVPCFLADRTVDGPPVPHARFHFVQRHLAAKATDDTITLDDWVGSSFAAPGDLLLQMDIEGAEYEVLAAASQATLSRFRIIVLELHDLHHARRAAFLDRISRAFKRLHETHAIVHLHPNNCRAPRKWLGLRIHPVMEITMLRRDRVRRMTPVRTLPHPLDRSNIPGAREWALDENWLAQTGDRT